MNQHIKTSVGIIVIVIIAITVGMYVWQTEKSQPDTVQINPVVTKGAKDNIAKPADVSSGVNASTSQPTENIVYTNTVYGFKLTMPKGWGKYTAKTVDSSDANTPNHIVSIFLPTTDKKYGTEAEVLEVLVWNASDWNKHEARCKSEPGPDCATNIKVAGKTNELVYEIVANDKTTLPSDVFSQYGSQLSSVIASFEIVK